MQTLRTLLFLLLLRPLLKLFLDVKVRHRERLRISGPAIIVANHNSHLDTLVLMTLLPVRELAKVRPVAAADYFLRNRWLGWLALNLIRIVPLARSVRVCDRHRLDGCVEALEQGDILILFPEGTRGEPEQLSEFKPGIAHLARRFPDTPVVPVFLDGLGKALPKGESLLVPFNCHAKVGETMIWNGDKRKYLRDLQRHLNCLSADRLCPRWA
jgi:1-acyl-sn-glycerol-3-phosphate acyltransferase